MAKVRQPYAEPVIVPWLGGQAVNPGQVVAVRDEQLPGFLEAGWQPGDAATKKAADELAKAAASEDVKESTDVAG